MLTDRGQPYTRQRINNTWSNLQKRIERDTGVMPAWWLPFKYLRRTEAQFVRQASDGEIAGGFSSHGQPVATDELADAYANRPFDRVAETLDEVRDQLKFMFTASTSTFTSTTLGKRTRRKVVSP